MDPKLEMTRHRRFLKILVICFRKKFLVKLLERLCFVLSKITVFNLIVRKLFPKITKGYGFTERWVLLNVGISIFSLFLCFSKNVRWWEWILIIYGTTQVYEIIIVQLNVLLFDKIRKEKTGEKYFLLSYVRSIICAVLNYIEILFWFSLYYRNFSCSFHSERIALDTVSGSLYFSLVTMSTLGYGDISPKNSLGISLCFLQTVIGIFMALLILGRLISLLPKVESISD